MSDRRCDFRINSVNSDYIIEEVPLLPDFDSLPKNYTYLWLKKSNYSTFEALEKLRDFYGLEFADVAAEGLKDEDGITSQIISIRKILDEKSVAEFNKIYNKDDNYLLIERIMGHGAEPVVAKALHGNMFYMIVRNLTTDEADRVFDYLKEHKVFPFINYYASQRFGLPGGPYVNHLVGEAICKNDWDKAFELFKTSGNEIPAGKTGKAAFSAINPSLVGFCVSAYNSFLWNKAVSEYLGSVTEVEGFEFKHVGELNLPTNVNFMPVSEFKVDGYRFDPETFTVNRRDFKRNIAYPTTIYADAPKDDELFPGKKCLRLSFFLSTGCYASMMIEQIMRAVFKD